MITQIKNCRQAIKEPMPELGLGLGKSSKNYLTYPVKDKIVTPKIFFKMKGLKTILCSATINTIIDSVFVISRKIKVEVRVIRRS